MEYATAAAAQESDFAEKDPTGRYVRYAEILGEGSFKTVYKAFDQDDGIEVAWSVIDINKVSPSPQQLEQLHSEMSILRSVNHKNLMKFHTSWVDDEKNTINMITELLTSGSLKQYRNKHKKLDIKAVKNWARQILDGLQYLHSHTPQIIHRDIKCDNIFVNGYSGKVKIGDLGFAMELKDQQGNAKKGVVGTPDFMAPELYRGDYNELIDIYAFGMCMLELVTGEYPYVECKNFAQTYKRVMAGVKPASLGEVVDPKAKQFIEKCLVPAPTRPSAAQLLNDPFLLTDTATKGKVLNAISTDPASLGEVADPKAKQFIEKCLVPAPTRPSAAQLLNDPFLLSDTATKGKVLNAISTDPASLGEVADPKAKQFIEKCLVPASTRPSATQILNDLFLLSDTATTGKVLNAISTGDPNNRITCRQPAYHELETFKENTEIWLRGHQTNDRVVSLTMRLKVSPSIQTVEFTFSLDDDTALSIASEMAKECQLADKVMSVIAELLEDLIKKIVPSWKPSNAKKPPENFDTSETSFIDKDKSDIFGVSWYRQCFQDLLKDEIIFNAAKEALSGITM